MRWKDIGGVVAGVFAVTAVVLGVLGLVLGDVKLLYASAGTAGSFAFVVLGVFAVLGFGTFLAELAEEEVPRLASTSSRPGWLEDPEVQERLAALRGDVTWECETCGMPIGGDVCDWCETWERRQLVSTVSGQPSVDMREFRR